MIEKRRKLFIFRNLLMPYNSPWHEYLQSANIYYNYKVRMRARRKFSGFFLFVSEIICIFASTGENTYEISFESLSSGYHLLSLRAQDEKGRWSSVVSRPIFVANPQKVVAMEYFIDNDPGEGKAIAVKLPEDLSVPFAFEVATEQLEPGEHKFCVRAKGTDGIWTYLSKKSFTVSNGKAGDANSDGHVTVADAEAVAAHIMGQTPDNFNEKNANVNGDDKIDAADIVEIVNRIE